MRGLLRMFYKMPVRGLRRKADGTAAITEEQLAWPIVRWLIVSI